MVEAPLRPPRDEDDDAEDEAPRLAAPVEFVELFVTGAGSGPWSGLEPTPGSRFTFEDASPPPPGSSQSLVKS